MSNLSFKLLGKDAEQIYWTSGPNKGNWRRSTPEERELWRELEEARRQLESARLTIQQTETLNSRLARREQELLREELAGVRRQLLNVVRAAGGTQRVSLHTVLKAHTADKLDVSRDPASGDLVYRAYREGESDER